MDMVTTILVCILSAMAASLSSAGGVGGGSLYLPILDLVGGLDLKTATALSAFMVAGGSLSNVLCNNLLLLNGSSIDYDIALLSQPCMLLGVGAGVVCNVVFPEWLVTALFALFLGLSTVKTFQAGFVCWNAESDGVVRVHAPAGGKGVEEALLMEEEGGGAGYETPWAKLAVLMLIWLCFFVLHVLNGDKDGKIITRVRPCGLKYWLITSSQVPIAIGFTAYILYRRRRNRHNKPDQQKVGMDTVVYNTIEALPVVVFPMAALLSGVLGGLFGIGGGLLINPVLLQIGVPPQVTAATTSFMVLFSSSMSMVQYLILGMKDIKQALVFSAVCFVASIVGLVTIQRAIVKSGRVSLIVFSVSAVMALSAVSITCFGAVDVWRKYIDGKNMGFKLPC
ncbi:Uncharacterized protein M6B38_245880 [Iris pallida]|uniref:Sulfite exporter TauE/SafE family protein n=1 Tax=Iris pallida TaxID=29817 RepID=A0AAX6DHD6_IRIPA|nr:Uncharacterized protein M6B38_245880 [Iris pallida]